MGERPGWVRLISKILLCGLLIYLGLGGLALLSQKSLTYHPRSARVQDEAFLASYPWLHRVQFLTSDEMELHAVWAPPAEGQAVLLFSHGNAGNLLGRIPLVEKLQGMGLGVFLYDYRGFGRSQGSPGEEGLYRDVEAAWEWVSQEGGVPPERIISYGRSLGAAVALHLALSRPVGGIILEVPFTSIRDMARRVLPFFPTGPFLRESYDNLQKISSLSGPLLVMVAEDDQVVAPWMGKALFEGAHEPKRLLVVPGAGHDDIPWTGRLYQETLHEFLATLQTISPPFLTPETVSDTSDRIWNNNWWEYLPWPKQFAFSLLETGTPRTSRLLTFPSARRPESKFGRFWTSSTSLLM